MTATIWFFFFFWVKRKHNNLILSIVESEFNTKQYKVSPTWIGRDVGLKWCNEEGESVTGQHICLVCNCPCTINYLNDKGEVSDEVCQPSCTVIPKAHLYMEWSGGLNSFCPLGSAYLAATENFLLKVFRYMEWSGCMYSYCLLGNKLFN